MDTLNYSKDSTLVANLMAWVQNKSTGSAFELLTKLQHAHFVLGNELTDKDSVSEIIDELKLSPPAKSLQVNKLTKDAEFAIHDITEIQDIIGTQAIPAMLLAYNENLVLLNHDLYLENPSAIVDAVTLELENLS
jgi:protein-disulfide isomerase-like protein with CxxC motif